jgi:hypothetical protein
MTYDDWITPEMTPFDKLFIESCFIGMAIGATFLLAVVLQWIWNLL